MIRFREAMKKTTIFLVLCLTAAGLLQGCGSGSGALPPDYLGTFKTTHANSGNPVTVKITQDDGTTYTGFIATIPVNAKWGETTTESGGLTSYRLDKGNDTNFLDYYMSFSSVTFSGTAVRQ